jgi:hypothetical protein
MYFMECNAAESDGGRPLSKNASLYCFICEDGESWIRHPGLRGRADGHSSLVEISPCLRFMPGIHNEAMWRSADPAFQNSLGHGHFGILVGLSSSEFPDNLRVKQTTQLFV